MFHSKSLICAPLWMALLIAPAAASANLLQNGTFATGNFTDWTLSGQGTSFPDSLVNVIPDGGVPADTLTTGSPDLDAGEAAWFTIDIGTTTMSQNIYLVPGTYTLGYDVLVPDVGVTNPFDATFAATIPGTSVSVDADAQTLLNQVGDDTWVTESAQDTITTAGDYDIDFSFTGDGSTAKDMRIDRAFLTADEVPVPEPASWTLLAAALLATAALSSRRRQRPR